MDYVFVLDVSGSMNEDQKLAMSQRSLGAFISALSDQDRFEMIAFNTQPRPLFSALKSADAAAKEQANAYLNSQDGRGGTALDRALVTAYKYADAARPLNVVVLSDGLTDQTERVTLSQLIRQRPAGSRVFAVGVGNDVNRALLEQVADGSGGLAAFISRGDDFSRQAESFRRKLTRPVATDLAIKIDGADVYDLEPKQLPNLYHGMPVRLYGRYRKAGEAKVTVSAKVGDQSINRAVNVNLPKVDDTNPEIERMWAWHRIDRLLKESDAAGSRTSALDEVIRLGEGYSIATEYTSFIVLENDGEYQRWKIERKNELRFARDERNHQRLADELAQMRNQATAQIGPAPLEAVAPAAGDAKSVSVRQEASAAPVVPLGDGRGKGDLDLPALPGARGGGAFGPIAALAAGALVLASTKSRRRS
jgi:Ca-activated chloride channel family protein